LQKHWFRPQCKLAFEVPNWQANESFLRAEQYDNLNGDSVEQSIGIGYEADRRNRED
jgi:hypothetical protein